ncbi:hypothetical protein J7K41_01450 [Candidatus Micrarchaeota archaeon]|nr:hypothetical protein [Candidatus Micrarchaeota archaeon]
MFTSAGGSEASFPGCCTGCSLTTPTGCTGCSGSTGGSSGGSSSSSFGGGVSPGELEEYS